LDCLVGLVQVANVLICGDLLGVVADCLVFLVECLVDGLLLSLGNNIFLAAFGHVQVVDLVSSADLHSVAHHEPSLRSQPILVLFSEGFGHIPSAIVSLSLGSPDFDAINTH